MKKSIILCILLMIVFLTLTGCRKEEKIKVDIDLPMSKANNLVNHDDYNSIEKILKSVNLDNINIFKSWVSDFNSGECKDCGLLTEWTDYKKIEYKESSLANHWEEAHTESDADCRMTSFLLISNHLKTSNTIKKNGSYLMFDIDAIDNVEKYSILKESKERFITLFNEIDVNGLNKDEIKDVYSKKWKEYGITLNNDKVSLINVVMYDNYDNIVFVGHSGLLIELDDKILFIEKIAFEQPYQVTVLKDRNELKEMLFARKSYFEDDTEEGPFIYENDKLIYQYNKNIVKNTIKGNIKTYDEMTDETWMCDGYIYKYRLEITGRMPNAAVDSTFIYLSNSENISFEKAYMASGISSNSNDYFSLEEAVLVEMM